MASPAGARARLSVLVLHRVLAVPDTLFPKEVDAAHFTQICRWVRSMFNVLPLDAAVRGLRAGTLPQRALAITFDDGYADNRHVALPILQQFGLTATVFVATGFLDGGCMWNDIVIDSIRRSRVTQLDLRDLLGAEGGPYTLQTLEQRRYFASTVVEAVKYLGVADRLARVREIGRRLEVSPPEDLMMTSGDVQALHRAGMQIGAHTVSHPILAVLSDDEARHEMQESKRTLENLIDDGVPLFAFPNGKPGEDYDSRSVMLAREVGFEAAMTTVRGAASPSSDLYQLPRFTPWDRTRLRFGARMLSTLCAPGNRPLFGGAVTA